MAHMIDLPLQDLTEYVRKLCGQDTCIHSLRLSTLEGGYVARHVYRLDARIKLADSGAADLAFVQKQTHAAEIRVMRLLSDLALDTLPMMISDHLDDTPQTGDTNWFITPFYEGRTLGSDEAIPVSIIKTLAHVHAAFRKQAAKIDWLPQVDGAFVEGLFRYIGTHLAAHRDRLPDAIYDDVQDLLKKTEIVTLLDEAFQQMPKTLVHGDVHRGNIIQQADGTPLLFDWGNARIAPGMLDLANVVNMDNANWTIYLDTWAKLTGEPFTPDVAQRLYAWATAIVNLQYIAYAIEHLEPSVIEAMAGRVRASVRVIASSGKPQGTNKRLNREEPYKDRNTTQRRKDAK